MLVFIGGCLSLKMVSVTVISEGGDRRSLPTRSDCAGVGTNWDEQIDELLSSTLAVSVGVGCLVDFLFWTCWQHVVRVSKLTGE